MATLAQGYITFFLLNSRSAVHELYPANIGIKHDFLCINICLAPREMLRPEPERRGFQPLPRGLIDVNVSEKHV